MRGGGVGSASGPGVARQLRLGIDTAGRSLADSSCGEATGPGGAGLQVIAAFPKPIEDLAVAGGQGHLEMGSRFRGGQVQDGVDQAGSGPSGQVAGLYMEVGMDRWAVGS